MQIYVHLALLPEQAAQKHLVIKCWNVIISEAPTQQPHNQFLKKGTSRIFCSISQKSLFQFLKREQMKIVHSDSVTEFFQLISHNNLVTLD